MEEFLKDKNKTKSLEELFPDRVFV